MATHSSRSSNSSDQVKVTAHDKEILKQLFNPGLPYGDDVDEDFNDNGEAGTAVESENIKQAKLFEVSGVKAAEAGDVDKALSFFNKAVEVAPEWASSYNNRAQALRLKGDIEGAKQDLDNAIELSNGKGSVACQAFTQRGLIRKKQEDEEGARSDLENAANLGGGFAKQVLAAMNPYAALCNDMLSNVINKLRAGESEAEI